MTEKFLIAIRKILREEIRTEMSIFREQLIKELNTPVSKERISETLSRVAPKRPTPPAPTPTGTRKSLLQTILEETEPIDDDLDYILEESEPIRSIPQRSSNINTPMPQRTAPTKSRTSAPLVTEDINGAPVNVNNPKVKKVLDVMNMNFGSKLKEMEEIARRSRGNL